MIPSERSHLFTAAITHPGMSGKSNEDRYAITAYRLDDDSSTPTVFAIVADGIGGHKAGEVAAEIAVNTISHAIALSDGDHPQKILEYAIVQAAEAIHRQAVTEDSQRGMGSTCACVWIIGERLYTASVGDSRIYLLRDGQIQQISIDHTWVQEALDHGIIKPDQAHNHPRSHIIRRYLGSKNGVVPDLRLQLSPKESEEVSIENQGMALLPGDRLLLCSDGLTDLVGDHEIRDTLVSSELSSALSSLVDMANSRGGHDNITILAVRIPTPDETPAAIILPAPERRKMPISWMTCAVIGFLVLTIGLLSAASIWGIWYFNHTDNTPTPTTLSGTAVPEATLAPSLTESTPRLTSAPSDTPIGPTLTPWPTNPPEKQATEPITPTPESN